MTFTPLFLDNSHFGQSLGKIICVGRNYAEHAKELNNPVPTEPILFIKPATAAVRLEDTITAPAIRGEVHYETELALLIGKPLSNTTPERAEAAVVGLGLALDLTLRDVQAKLKGKGHPWEISKGFDGACPLSSFVKVSDVPNWDSLSFSLSINEELRQIGRASDMLFSIPQLLVEMSRHFTLEPGDVILTGTPAGVGILPRGATLHFSLDGAFEFTTQVAP
jgi:2-keto-4-pentenoate hydratase/2-oxohepta-3-ene-1,7-dioic acid hydratase in catechol pathway